jgi:hypothetical protein
MRRLLLLLFLAFIAAPRAGGADDSTADPPPPLPPCATDGDMDGDGVPDDLDSAMTDSCTASASGFEDCDTGAGDGIPDCQ